MTKILTIQKVKPAGKWMEFWFFPPKDGEPMPTVSGDVAGYQLSCKAYPFGEAISAAGLDIYILNNGVVGLKTKWTNENGQWEFDSIVLDEQFETT